ncbi:MAG TPA: hypothetical protein VLE95_07615 [Chlamydiales bacterium]|nr:hypothetical protein [Chlamydiales bacterium]
MHRIASFNNIRSVLLSCSREMAHRRTILSVSCSFAKGISGIVEMISGAGTIVAFIATFQFPLLGGCFTLSSFFTFLSAHEIRVIAKNGEELVGGSILLRGKAAWTPEQFTRILLKDTLITHDFFGSFITKILEYTL